MGALTAAIGVLWAFHYFSRDLPSIGVLSNYQPPTTTRLHAATGELLSEYATERRLYVPIDAIPLKVKQAFLAAEDKNFYKHEGIDFFGVARAVYTNIKNYGTGRRLVGASTITQQVAKNFLLTNEVSFERKIKEAILAHRIDRAFPKDDILRLYLNEIYLGSGSYGVASAALKYFNKALDDLTIAEAAYLAALPKAPNNYHPVRQPYAARARRDWVIDRMLEEGFVNRTDAFEAKQKPIEIR
ncbi:MAG: transglycosylase domain-containing protein, partial [Pseudomonadota bacterium]